MADRGRDNWGRWGAEDERGALNLLTDEVVLDAVRACRTGRVYNLALPLQREGVPAFAFRGPPQRYTLAAHDHGDAEGLGSHEDVLVTSTHATTHVDALCHIHADGTVYNGFPEATTSAGGAAHCSIEKAGGFAARGVLLDLAALAGVDALAPGHVIGAQDLLDAMERQRVEVRAGDAVLIRTGWLERFLATGGPPSAEQPGIGLAAARLLAERDVAVVGADNSGVEALPFGEGHLAVHVELLVRRGIHLIEHVQVAQLATDRCHEFLLVLGLLPITGAAGSPVNPIAIG